MQTTAKKTDGKVKNKEKIPKDEAIKSTKDEKKKNLTVSTPRNYVHKTSTTDIYGLKKKISSQVDKAPKKTNGLTKTANESPMKNLLKSSASSISQISRKSENTSKNDTKIQPSRKIAAPKLGRELSFSSVTGPRSTDNSPIPKNKSIVTSVTVNSPVPKKKSTLTNATKNERHKGHNLNRSGLKEEVVHESKNVNRSISKSARATEEAKILNKDIVKEVNKDRQRTKTRTLDENEVKVLTPDAVDNNVAMFNLSRTLTAKPKAFYVDLDEQQSKHPQKDKVCDEEVSYEDDFESYESDFDSYQSSEQNSNGQLEQTSENDEDEHFEESSEQSDEDKNKNPNQPEDRLTKNYEDNKEIKDEERMLDSGNFDLRESQRSANRGKPAVMDFILEDRETDVKASLTDEGFQDMSSSSAVSSMKTVHVDVLDRPLFIDFKKSKENKRRRQIFEQLKQRAHDILSMVTLHEMSYSLFEMKPIPYDLYMTTFGRSNYTQIATQTFDDGVTAEVQTEEIDCDDKWTQHPVEFSNNDIYLKTKDATQKYKKNREEYLSKFTFLMNQNSNDDINNKNPVDKNYEKNPLLIYLEQKDGAGSCEVLPYKNYKLKLKNNDYNVNKLRKFLKKIESKIGYILSMNTHSKDLPRVIKTSEYPFSKGYVSLNNKNITDNKLSFVRYAKITNVVFSDSKSNFIITIHTKSGAFEKCIACLWDLSVAGQEPIKVLTAIDNITISRFKGNTDGIFIGALEDGSIHLWDLSEEPMWRNIIDEDKTTSLVEIKTEAAAALTETENDREWNLQNSNVAYDPGPLPAALQSCAYTSSALNMTAGVVDSVVGLEVGWDTQGGQDGRKVLGQVCSLQRIGILTIWSIIQEKLSKNTSTDMGKAFWAKTKLEKQQSISLIEHINLPRAEPLRSEFSLHFNLNSAKRRMSLRKKEKSNVKKVSRPKSAAKLDSDRPSTANLRNKRVLPTESNWENGIVCNDLKTLKYGNNRHYLIAKNCGEVLCCEKSGGGVKVNGFSITNDASSVTCLEVSTQGLPYFLAATDVGTVNLCSILHSRVLLTLDCRNLPQTHETPATEKYNVDQKGRYMGSATLKNTLLAPEARMLELSVTRILWSAVNPCCIFSRLREGGLIVWDLTHSDIYAKCASEKTVFACALKDNLLALLTADGEVQVHRLASDHDAKDYLQIFNKYAMLL